MMKPVKRDAIGRRAKRFFSHEDKQKLFHEWRNSGLRKSQFSKEKGLSSTAFALWCKTFETKKDWLPLVSKETTLPLPLILFEVTIPNGMVFKTSFNPTEFLSFLKSLEDAFTTVR